MFKPIIIFLTLLTTFHNTKAQDDTVFNEVLAFHLFHLVNNGIRIDYDRRLGNNHWIQIGPQFYASERSDDNDFREYNELLGAGFSLYHRMYLGNRKPSLGTYFSYGFTYNYFNLKYDDDGNSNTLAETNINKFGGDIVIGYQTRAFEKLIVDIYAGLGGRYADLSFRGTRHRKFNEFMYDYGFTGNVLIVGIRFGFGF